LHQRRSSVDLDLTLNRRLTSDQIFISVQHSDVTASTCLRVERLLDSNISQHKKLIRID